MIGKTEKQANGRLGKPSNWPTRFAPVQKISPFAFSAILITILP